MRLWSVDKKLCYLAITIDVGIKHSTLLQTST